jgi:hypothetical protein
MGLIHNAVRWYRFNHGDGKRMLDRGAELMRCPYCEEETPIYRSAYDSTGMPISFSVCLWCEGILEYSGASRHPHEPYATAREIRAERQRSKP